MKKIYGVYGASGFGSEVIPLLKEKLEINDELVFIDDNFKEDSFSGYKVISFEQFCSFQKEKFVTIAIANSKIREKLTIKCEKEKIKIISVKASNVVKLDNIEIQDGSILTPFVTLTSNIKIGKSFHANIYSYVAHDCIIGDYVTFAPGVKCNGNVHIGNHVYIGTGVIIHQGKQNRPIKIGDGAVIAAGAVVTKSIPNGMTVFGNPAIEFTKENIKRRS